MAFGKNQAPPFGKGEKDSKGKPGKPGKPVKKGGRMSKAAPMQRSMMRGGR